MANAYLHGGRERAAALRPETPPYPLEPEPEPRHVGFGSREVARAPVHRIRGRAHHHRIGRRRKLQTTRRGRLRQHKVGYG